MWYNSLSNEEILARTLEAEAGNQGLGGMIAVGAVIANRTGGGQSIRDTILKPGQFSAWNSVTGYANGLQGQDMQAIRPSQNAYAAARSVLSGNFVDPTNGATHYYNPDLANPSWGAAGGGTWQTIGNHVFGRPAGEGNPIPTSGKNPPPLTNPDSATNHPVQSQDKNMAIPPSTGMGFVNANGFIDAPYPQARPTPANNQGMQGQTPGQQTQNPLGKIGSYLADPRARQLFGTFSRTEFGKKIYDNATRDIGRNQTAAWLRTQEGGAPYADAIENGALTAEQAYSQWNSKRTQKRNVREVNGNLVDIDTGEIVYGSDVQGRLTSDQFTALKAINADLLKRVKPFEEVRDGFRRIQTLFNNPSGVSDYALAVSFAKILDPGSVAREGEVAAVANAGSGVMSVLRRAENFFKGDGTLPAPVRTEIMYIASQNYAQMLADAQRALEDAKTQASGMGIDHMFLYKVPMPPMPELNLPDRNPTKDGDGTEPENEVDYNENGPVPPWAEAAGYNQSDWNALSPDVVQALTDAYIRSQAEQGLPTVG